MRRILLLGTFTILCLQAICPSLALPPQSASISEFLETSTTDLGKMFQEYRKDVVQGPKESQAKLRAWSGPMRPLMEALESRLSSGTLKVDDVIEIMGVLMRFCLEEQFQAERWFLKMKRTFTIGGGANMITSFSSPKTTSSFHPGGITRMSKKVPLTMRCSGPSITLSHVTLFLI